jgi:Ca2+:H+ antiporter
VALILPAIADASVGPAQGDVVGKEVSAISAAILLLLYITYLLFDLFHVRDLEYIQQHRAQKPIRSSLNPETAPITEYRAEERLTALNARRERGKETRMNPFVAGVGLIAVLVATVYLSETLVEIARTITEAGEPIRIGMLSLGTLQLSPAFVGLVLIPIIGTAAEHLSAIRSAMDGRTEITITVTAGAAIQVALLAAPLFVLLSFFIAPQPFALLFSPIELAVFGLATFLFYLVTEDGEGTWLEGALLLAFYLIFAGTALFLPK